MLSRANGATYTFVSREGGVQTFTGHPWPRGTERASELCVKSRAKRATHTFVSREGGVQSVSVVIGDRIAGENIAGTAPKAGTASEGIMPLSDEDGAALIAGLKREMRELESARREKETMKQETKAMKADLERNKRKLEKVKWEKGLQTREMERLQYETELEWPQSETVEMPMFPLLEGPEQSAPTTVALAAETPATEVMTDTRVFPGTAGPYASVDRAVIKLTSAAGPSSTICGERRAFRYYKSSGNGSNSNSSNISKSSGNGSSSGSNDPTSNHDSWWEAIYIGAMLRPFDPGKRCRRSARGGKTVLGMDLPFDRGKSWGRMQHGG